MPKLIRMFLLLSITTLSSWAQHLKEVPANALKRGDPAPPLGFEFVLQGPQPDAIKWAALRGKVVNFWGTWCAPCVGRIPQLNELISHYKDKPVQFIAVGHENPRRVEWFLKTHPIETWIALDTDLSVYKAYTAWGIPYAVVVDQEGKVAAVLNPAHLTHSVIDSVLAGKAPAYPRLSGENYFDPETAAEYFLKLGQEEPPAH